MADCFLQIQLTGTKVRGPTMAQKTPEVLLEVERQPAKEASQKRARLQSSGESPTTIYKIKVNLKFLINV